MKIMRSTCAFCSFVLAGTLSIAIPTATAQFTALDSTRTTGNQGWTGPLGMDFDVLAPITVTQLGAFDSGLDGFLATITVGIFDRATMSLVGSSVTLTGTNQALSGQSRFFDVADFGLSPGGYSIVAHGFSSSDPNGNTGLGGSGPTVNGGGGLISFVNSARYGNFGAPFGYPTNIDTGPANRYDAGTFTYVAAVPEPEIYAMMGLGLGLLGWMGRRRKS